MNRRRRAGCFTKISKSEYALVEPADRASPGRKRVQSRYELQTQREKSVQRRGDCAINALNKASGGEGKREGP